MRAASRSGKRGSGSGIPILGPIPVAPPGDHVEFLVHIGLGFRGSIAGDHVQVFGEGDLGVVDLFVVGLECCWVDFCVGLVVRAGDVVEGWGPFLRGGGS